MRKIKERLSVINYKCKEILQQKIKNKTEAFQGVTFGGTYMTPFGGISISSFKSRRTCKSGRKELTPRVFSFEGKIFPRHVQKQRLYAIIIDG